MNENGLSCWRVAVKNEPLDSRDSFTAIFGGYPVRLPLHLVIHRGLAKSLDGDARTTPIYIKSIVIHRGLEPRTH